MEKLKNPKLDKFPFLKHQDLIGISLNNTLVINALYGSEKNIRNLR